MSLRGKGQRDRMGTRVVVESALGTQTKFVKGSSSYAPTDDAHLLLGLAADEKILKATGYWSHGDAQEVKGLTVNHYHEVTEGSPSVKILAPK